MSGSSVSAARRVRAKLNVQAIQASWVNLNSLGVMLRPIANEKEHTRMVKFLDVLVDYVGDDEDHPLSSLLDLVGDLVSRYEQEHYPIKRAAPKDVLRALMENRGLKQADLSEIVPQSNLSAILSGRRKISARLAGKLGKFFGVSAAVFVPVP